jgi:predicted deacylase
MGARATLLAADSGGCPFDESNSQIWWLLAEKFPDHPIVPACLAATVELRGAADTLPLQTEQDCFNLYTFLKRRGFLAGEPAPLPELLHQATPLAGVDYIKAETAGILSYLKEPGEMVAKGEVIARLIDPMAEPGQVAMTEIASITNGVLFARACDRFARPGKIVAKVAGATPLAGKGKQLLTL